MISGHRRTRSFELIQADIIGRMASLFMVLTKARIWALFVQPPRWLQPHQPWIKDIPDFFNMSDKTARTHTHKSNRSARHDNDSKVVFKSVLDNPFRIQWYDSSLVQYFSQCVL
jgi:hypothetical protein